LGLSRLLTFDISDCRNPKALGEMTLPGPPHEFFLWQDASRVLAYATLFDHAPPSLVVVDLTQPESPTEVARWSAADDGAAGLLHSLSVTDAGDTAYLALWKGGFAVAEIDLPHIAIQRDASGAFAPARWTNTHSAVPMEGPYVLIASEIYGCPFGRLAVVDISDPSHPVVASQLTIPENRCNDIPTGGVFSPHNPLVVGHLAFSSWYAAGVQAFDLTDPLAPQRVGQFVPSREGAAATSLLGTYPVQTFSYPILRNGLFYVVDSQSGLYVLRYLGSGAEQLAQIRLAEGNVTIR
jgi:hypothetical protein